MRLLAAVLLVFALIAAVLWGAQPVEAKAEPFHIYQTVETARNEPWLRTDCYDDDHTLTIKAQGHLDADETFIYTTPMPVCGSKILRGFVWAAKRDAVALVVTDWYGDEHPGRKVALPKGQVGYAACNTDSKSDVQVMLEDEIEAPASWSVTALTAGTYRLEMVMNEPWWQGNESPYGYCGHTP